MPGSVAVSPSVRLFSSSPCGRTTVEWCTQSTKEKAESTAMRSCRSSSLGQHAALKAISRRLRPGEGLFAFLDDIWFVTKPERVGDVHSLAERELWREAGIQVHTGKTHVWNRSGTKPPECNAMQRRAVVNNPDARVWLGSEVPTRQQGIKVLGCPLGHDDFIAAELQALGAKHQILLQAIPAVQDLQSAWLLLLHCAAARANCFVRVLRPDVVQPFAESHDTNVWQCLCNILGIPEEGCSDVARISATLPLALGGLGLRSAQRTCVAAHWASWADTLPMIAARHPTVADIIRRSLESDPQSPSLAAARRAADELDGTSGFEVPRWAALQEGLRPPPREPEHHEPGGTRAGWQHEAASRVERQFRTEVLLPQMSAQQRAKLRSQSGPVAGVPFSTAPSSPLTRIEPALFRVLLQRRLSLPLPLTVRSCQCGRLLDAFGHHRTACSRSGVLGRRGFALESAAARVCREAGGRVATNILVRDLDLGTPDARDARRLEVVVDGLPLFGGAQLAVDTTLVSAIQGNGEPRNGAAERDGVALAQAKRKKARTYPELVRPGARARLVVLALETGGRWSKDARTFVQLLTRARARSEPRLIQRRVEQAWRLRWYSILSCAAARALAASLLELRGRRGADGQVPQSHDVEREFCNAGLSA